MLALAVVVVVLSHVSEALGFRDHARAGVPMTLLSRAVALAWLGLGGWPRW